jgi:urea carboxylase
VEELKTVLSKSSICGPPTNLDFLLAILKSPEFEAGHTITQFLSNFAFRPPAIDVLAGGSYTLVEDYPGRPTIGKGFGHGGPMDPISFQIANALVGNPLGKEGLEITLTGPDLRFLADAVVSLTGAAIAATLDGKDFPMWRRVRINAGQRLTIGKTLSNAGCRSYLAVYGGFLNVAEWFGSKATVPQTLVGGYQGRPLATVSHLRYNKPQVAFIFSTNTECPSQGDMLRIADTLPPEPEASHPTAIPESIWPKHDEHWVLHVMHGPYCEGYLSPEDIDMFYSTYWEVSHNSARGGIRLVGPRPKWARTSGGEGGSHPSNVIEYGYPIGGVNFTGDEPVIFPNDGPDFGGFVCPFTVVKADYWKVGQLRAGNTVKFVAASLEDALRFRRENTAFVDNIVTWLATGSSEPLQSLDATSALEAPSSVQPAVIKLSEATPSRPQIAYRQGGDDYLLIDYGGLILSEDDVPV